MKLITLVGLALLGALFGMADIEEAPPGLRGREVARSEPQPTPTWVAVDDWRRSR